jgi:methyl-accepting chemotaxis protein
MRYKIKYLNAKIITALIISLAAGFIILGMFQIRQQKQDMLLDFISNINSITHILDKQLSSVVKWKKTNSIKSVYKDLVEDPNSIISAIKLFDINGVELNNYESDKLPKADLMASWNNFKNIDQTVTTFDLPEHYVIITPVKFGKDDIVVGYLEISWSKEDVLKKVSESAHNLILVVIAIQTCVILLLGTLLRIIVTKPIIRITHAMNELASGITNIEIPFLTRDDEIGRMAYALNIFKDNAIKSIELKKRIRC